MIFVRNQLIEGDAVKRHSSVHDLNEAVVVYEFQVMTTYKIARARAHPNSSS